MPRPEGSPNKSARELKMDVEIAELKYEKKVLADEKKVQAEEIKRLKKK